MSREIRFRAWDKEDGVMFYSRETNFCSMKSDRPDKVHEVVMEGSLSYISQAYPLMQYTGLKDINGDKIYDGDIVKDDRGHVYKIFWNDIGSGGWWFLKRSNIHADSIRTGRKGDALKVIGNIYENPELMS